MAKKYTTIALVYDFDGTLAPGNMQERSFLPNLGIDKNDFWKENRRIAEENDMNEILSYMQLMLKKASEKGQQITKRAFEEHGRLIDFFDGVEEYFGNINRYAQSKGIKIKHYIVSSGLKDILKGSRIYKYFDVVFASAYKYDVNGVAVWPSLAIDYTNKTQFLFRINKGIDNAWDNSKINKFIEENERPIPFSKMIYIGDGETDVPSMKMINLQGGTSIAVYNPNLRSAAGKRAKKTCEELITQKRATYIAPAKYTVESDLFKIIQLCIDKIAASSELEKYAKIMKKME